VATEIFAKASRAAGSDLDGPAAVRAMYAQPGAAADAALAASPLGRVDDAVDAVVRALDARRPDTRYVQGRSARLIVGLRRLPDRMRDRVLLRSLGVRAAHFDPAGQEGAAAAPDDLQPTGG
jgi:hypothetical protein